MPVQHNSLTGSDLHEPKGIATAATNTYYKANGSGSGSWVKTYQTTTGVLLDTSVADSIVFCPFPVAATVKKVIGILDQTVTSAGATLTVTVYTAANVALGNLTFTVAGSTAGDTAILNIDQAVTADSHLYAKIVGDVTTEKANIHLGFYSEVT